MEVKKKLFLIVIVCSLFISGCNRSVSMPLREIASEFVSYFVGKELLDPLLYPDKTKDEIKKLKEKLGKELFNHIWADFGEKCKDNESLLQCKARINKRLRGWTDLYTDEFIKLYKECEEEALSRKDIKIDIINRFQSAEECIIKKDNKYRTLFELSKKL